MGNTNPIPFNTVDICIPPIAYPRAPWPWDIPQGPGGGGGLVAAHGFGGTPSLSSERRGARAYTAHAGLDDGLGDLGPMSGIVSLPLKPHPAQQRSWDAEHRCPVPMRWLLPRLLGDGSRTRCSWCLATDCRVHATSSSCTSTTSYPSHTPILCALGCASNVPDPSATVHWLQGYGPSNGGASVWMGTAPSLPSQAEVGAVVMPSRRVASHTGSVRCTPGDRVTGAVWVLPPVHPPVHTEMEQPTPTVHWSPHVSTGMAPTGAGEQVGCVTTPPPLFQGSLSEDGLDWGGASEHGLTTATMCEWAGPSDRSMAFAVARGLVDLLGSSLLRVPMGRRRGMLTS